MGYTGFREVTDIDHEDSQSALLAGFDIERDAMGNPLWVEFAHKGGTGHLYAYDKAGRLTSAQMWSADPSAEAADSDWDDEVFVQRIDFDLDRVGNRNDVTHTDYGQQGVETDHTFNSVNNTETGPFVRISNG